MRNEKFKILDMSDYKKLIFALVVSSLVAVLSSYYAYEMRYEMQADNEVLKRDLQATIQKHNNKNHALRECEAKIIHGTCLLRIPDYYGETGVEDEKNS